MSNAHLIHYIPLIHIITPHFEKKKSNGNLNYNLFIDLVDTEN